MIRCQQESFDQIAEDIAVLLEDHWLEVEWGKDDIPLDPNFRAYQQADQDGTVVMFALRDGGALVGYNTFWIYNHPHHSGTVFAVNDMLYIKPEYRNGLSSSNMLWFCEEVLKEKGANVITYHMKPHKSFTKLMDYLGYEHTECVYSKFIGK